jgi:LacI family transcriptional regulator
MKKKKPIHDLAKELNLSATTISLVMYGKAQEKRISTGVAQKVLQYAKEVGYHPNGVAKSLRTGKCKTIGMLVEGISDIFFSGITRAVEEKSYKFGYRIFFSSTENDTSRAKALLSAFRDRAGGWLYFSSRTGAGARYKGFDSG